MYNNEFMKLLREQNWLQIEKDDPNKYQMWRRKRNQAIRGLEALTLLAKKLPSDKKKELFTYDTMAELMSQVLHTDDKNNPPDFELIQYLIRSCIMTMIKEYSLMNKFNPQIAKFTIDHLTRTQEICYEISKMVLFRNQQEMADKGNQIYLFRSTRYFIIDIDRFSAFLDDTVKQMKMSSLIDTDLEYLRFKNLSFSFDSKIVLDIIDPIASLEIGYDQKLGRAILQVDLLNLTGYLNIDIGKEQKKVRLRMKYDSHRKFYHYYLKSNEKNVEVDNE